MEFKSSIVLEDFLTKELAWRKKDITKSLLDYEQANSEKEKDYYWKISIFIIYSNWEGYIKNSAEAYINYLNNKNLKYKELSSNFKTIGIKELHKKHLHGDTKKYSIFKIFEDSIDTLDEQIFKINEKNVIDTGSNLKYDVLFEILNILNIPVDDFELKKNLIDSVLLTYRNDVAHGDRIENTKDIYNLRDLRDSIIGLLEIFKTNLQNSIALNSYRRIV